MSLSNVAMSHDLYRTAIALNNAGVSLLDRGRYQEALVVFKTTVEMLHSPGTFEDPHAALQSAYKSLSKPKEEPTSLVFRCQVLPHTTLYHGVSHLLSELGEEHASLREDSAYAILLDDPDFDRIMERNFDPELAIILNNYGMAILCLSKTVGFEDGNFQGHGARLDDGVKKMLLLSQCLIAAYRQRTRYETDSDLMDLVCLEVLVLGCLMNLRLRDGLLDNDLRALYSKFAFLRGLILALEGPGKVFSDSIMAPVA